MVQYPLCHHRCARIGRFGNHVGSGSLDLELYVHRLGRKSLIFGVTIAHRFFLSTILISTGMEPPLGQISFFLLCLQFSRAQMDNLGVKPYTTRVKHMRAQHLADLYPQYDRNLLMNFSMSKHIVHNE
uniref:Uncharacterized protein n=1 Tax=Entomoneis paludosa TaxID=265537 RepID=A0A7S2YT15_9STRA